MEKKAKFYFLFASLLLAGIGGAVIGFKVGSLGRSSAPPGSRLSDREIEDIERGLEDGGQRSVDGIEEAISTVGSFKERERSAIEGLENATGEARDVESGIGRIGENADRTSDGIEELGGIVEELRKRNGRKDP